MQIIQRISVYGCGDASSDGLATERICERVEHIEIGDLLVAASVRVEQSDAVIDGGDVLSSVGQPVDIVG